MKLLKFIKIPTNSFYY